MADFPTDPAEYPVPVSWGQIIVGMRVRGTFTTPSGGEVLVAGTVQSIEDDYLDIGGGFWTIQSPTSWREAVPNGSISYELVEPLPPDLDMPNVGSIVRASNVAYQRVGDPTNDRWLQVGGVEEFTLAELGAYTLLYDAPDSTEEV